MKILLVNNHSNHTIELLQKLEYVTVIEKSYLNKIDPEAYDAIILSGGSPTLQKDEKAHRKQLELIKTTKKPLLGICLGHELICYAYGETLQHLPKKEKGPLKITIKRRGRILKGLPKTITAYEGHHWIVPETTTLLTLATSRDGVEAVKHPTKDIYGTQFHPEVTLEKDYAGKVLENFLEIAKKRGKKNIKGKTLK